MPRRPARGCIVPTARLTIPCRGAGTVGARGEPLESGNDRRKRSPTRTASAGEDRRAASRSECLAFAAARARYVVDPVTSCVSRSASASEPHEPETGDPTSRRRDLLLRRRRRRAEWRHDARKLSKVSAGIHRRAAWSYSDALRRLAHRSGGDRREGDRRERSTCLCRCDGSASTGRCESRLRSGSMMSKVFRVSPKCGLPRSQRITFRLPRARIYSADTRAPRPLPTCRAS